MANYVKSIVKMKGVSSLPLFVTRLESGASTVEIDFNRIIPIPKSLKLRGGAIENWPLKRRSGMTQSSAMSLCRRRPSRR